MNKVLVLAVHPDGETLGCGGTLLKHKDNGHQIFWLIMTCISEDRGYGKDIVEQRDREIEEIKAQYRFDEVYSLKSLSLSLTNNSKLWEQKLPVYVEMDEQVPYGILMELMLLFKNAGFPQVGLVFKNNSQ